jgi:hypothetical protein
MPVVVPPVDGEDVFPVDISEEIRINRKLTKAFIDSDPTQLELVPTEETRTASGATVAVDLDPRPVQTFRLIPMASTERPVTSGQSGGQQRRYDFTLLGEWNCEMQEGDHWTDEVGQKWLIDSVVSNNGYERKGMVTSYGRRPRHA